MLVGISAVNLREYSFFTHVRIGSERLNIKAVKEFYAETTDEGLTLYRFRVPLPAPTAPEDIAVGLFDDSYYVDVWLAEAAIAAAARMPRHPGAGPERAALLRHLLPDLRAPGLRRCLAR